MAPDLFDGLLLGLLFLGAALVGMPVSCAVIGLVLGIIMPNVSKTRGALTGAGVGTLAMVLYLTPGFSGWRRTVGLTAEAAGLLSYALGVVATVAVVWLTAVVVWLARKLGAPRQ